MIDNDDRSPALFTHGGGRSSANGTTLSGLVSDRLRHSESPVSGLSHEVSEPLWACQTCTLTSERTPASIDDHERFERTTRARSQPAVTATETRRPSVWA